MKSRSIVIAIVSSIILLQFIPSVQADLSIILEAIEAEPLTPIKSGISQMDGVDVFDMCVTDDGRTFVVCNNRYWQSIRGATPCYIAGWDSDCQILWSEYSTNWPSMRFGISTDDTFLYTTGFLSIDGFVHLFVEKRDLNGNVIWNTTWNIGYEGWGYKIDTTDDGSIVIGGIMFDVPESSVGYAYILLVLDQDGQEKWHRVSIQGASYSCPSDYIYAKINGSIQKLTTDGNIIWSIEHNIPAALFAQNDILYTSVSQSPLFQASVSVSGLDSRNGENLWTHNITLHNLDNQIFNSSFRSYSITPEGNLGILLDAQEISRGYLTIVDGNGNLLLNRTLLDYNWISDTMAFYDENLLYVTGIRAPYNISIEIYDLSSSYHSPISLTSHDNTTTRDGLEIELIAVTIGGVIIFDIVLIIYLKKKYAQ